MKKPTEKTINRTLDNLARELENIETLETRISDHLDFTTWVCGISNALCVHLTSTAKRPKSYLSAAACPPRVRIG
ncbi:DUF6900 domain-containing protein [Chelonobacter oris]|uniref:DUF6900 domain-containing protein n=1 Tax=Chelonobacter oris TaxID=505317 RepID=UPI003CC60294